jgi:hypothetical protein
MSVTPAEVYLSFTYLRIFLEALGVVVHVGAIQLVFPWGLVMYEILFLGLFHASPHSVLFFLIFQYLESRLFISQPMYKYVLFYTVALICQFLIFVDWDFMLLQYHLELLLLHQSSAFVVHTQ